MCFRVALLQLKAGKSPAENMLIGFEACRKAKQMGADLALFPEMWNVGYQIPQDRTLLRRMAAEADGEYVSAFGKLAKELNMAIAITFLEAYDPSPRNTVRVFDRFGKPILTYAKLHTCDFGDERVLTAGERFETAVLQTETDAVRIGAMICYDREFPESARILMLQGAEVILTPNACPMEINRISQLRTRAYENMVGIATCNYAYGMPDCNGHSTAFDGIAYREEESGSRDTLIIEAGEREGIYMADFSLQELRKYRATEVHGNAYRHPQKYSQLTELCIREPFIRKDYRE